MEHSEYRPEWIADSQDPELQPGHDHEIEWTTGGPRIDKACGFGGGAAKSGPLNKACMTHDKAYEEYQNLHPGIWGFLMPYFTHSKADDDLAEYIDTHIPRYARHWADEFVYWYARAKKLFPNLYEDLKNESLNRNSLIPVSDISSMPRKIYKPFGKSKKAAVSISSSWRGSAPRYRSGSSGTTTISHTERVDIQALANGAEGIYGVSTRLINNTAGIEGGFPNESTKLFPYINPGNSQMFPWLSQTAANYEKYTFEYLEFTYKAKCSTSQEGNLTMCIDYDAQDNIPGSSAEMEQMITSVNVMPWNNVSMVAHPKVKKQGYVKSNSGTNSQSFSPLGGKISDARVSNAGNFYLATENCGSFALLGFLYVTYTVRLMLPQPRNTAISAAGMLHTKNFNPSSSPSLAMTQRDPFGLIANPTGYIASGGFSITVKDSYTQVSVPEGKWFVESDVSTFLLYDGVTPITVQAYDNFQVSDARGVISNIENLGLAGLINNPDPDHGRHLRRRKWLIEAGETCIMQVTRSYSASVGFPIEDLLAGDNSYGYRHGLVISRVPDEVTLDILTNNLDYPTPDRQP